MKRKYCKYCTLFEKILTKWFYINLTIIALLSIPNIYELIREKKERRIYIFI